MAFGLTAGPQAFSYMSCLLTQGKILMFFLLFYCNGDVLGMADTFPGPERCSVDGHLIWQALCSVYLEIGTGEPARPGKICPFLLLMPY